MIQFLNIAAKNHHLSWHQGAGGRPVVFINSLGTDLRIWDKVAQELPAPIPYLRSDKCGHGLSAGQSNSISDFANDLAKVMDQIGISEALICGVSIGGMIAQQIASKRPDLVAGLVLSNTSYQIGDDDSWKTRISAIERHGIEPMADDIMNRWFAPEFRQDRPNEVLGFRTMLTRTPVEGYLAACTAIRDANLEIDSIKLECPTLCLAGAEDEATPAAHVKALANLVDGAEYLCFDGVGHLPCIEAPSEFAKALLNFYEIL